MSTSYYGLKHPITCVRILDQNKTHTKIAIFTKHQNIGELCIDTPELHEFMQVLKSDRVLVHVSSKDINIISSSTTSNTVLISEHGELTSLSEIRRKYSLRRPTNG